MTDDDGDPIVVVAKGRLYLILTHLVFSCLNTKSFI